MNDRLINLAPAPPSAQSGQTMVFMIMVLVILSFVVLWNFDLHTVLHLKSRTQNAGDAAALAAARWQGITLNLVGDLNIMQAVLLSGGDTASAAQLTNLQARLCFAGPGIGLLAAQQAAKNNGIYSHADFTARLNEHATNVLADYGLVFTEPYQGCWQDYGALLQTVAGQGVAAGPDNVRYYTDYADGGHFLLMQSFYDAIEGRDWCWFYFNAMDLLEYYDGDWPELPVVIPSTQPANTEIFGLGLRPRTTALPGGADTVALMNTLRAARGLDDRVISNEVAATTNTWYTYDPAVWSTWNLISLEGDDPFPAAAAVKPQYNYAGADVVIRIEAGAGRLTPGAQGHDITWTAAAKPFGYLATDDGSLRPDSCSVVLPAFHNVRLIPADTASGPAGGSYNLAWRIHIEDHLPLYLQYGLAGLDAACDYCRQLTVWENLAFRDEGKAWLRVPNPDPRLANRCEVWDAPGGGDGGGGGGGGGGPGRGGDSGRRRGH